MEISFPLSYTVIFLGRNFRKAKINQIKLFIIYHHLNEVVRSNTEAAEVGGQGQENENT